MTTLLKQSFLLIAAFCTMMIANSAAAACPADASAGTWVVSGSPAAFSGSYTYYLGAIRVGASCTTKRVCELNDRGKPVCWREDVAINPTLSIGELSPSFDGPGTLSYFAPVESNVGGEGWRYADSTVNGNYTRVWYRWNNGAPQVVFEVWKNGVYQNPEWRNLVRG